MGYLRHLGDFRGMTAFRSMVDIGAGGLKFIEGAGADSLRPSASGLALLLLALGGVHRRLDHVRHNHKPLEQFRWPSDFVSCSPADAKVHHEWQMVGRNPSKLTARDLQVDDLYRSAAEDMINAQDWHPSWKGSLRPPMQS